MQGVQGWIKLHRQLLNSHVFQNEKLLKIWIWCLLKAAHTGRAQVVGRQKIQLEPGQFVTGRHAAAAELGMAPSTTWDYLKLLEAQECISIKSNNKFSVVTVVNWAFYQGYNENSDSKIDNKSKANGQQIDTINNVNNDNNVKNKRNKNKKSVSNKDDETIKAQDARSGKVDEEDGTGKSIKNARDAVMYFSSKFEEKFGLKYSANWGKDAKLMKELLETYGPELLAKMINIFLSEDDNWADKAGRTVGILKVRANSLALKATQHSHPDLINKEHVTHVTFVANPAWDIPLRPASYK